jgi:beta-1,4-N-acetylglucosaminyltransferase
MHPVSPTYAIAVFLLIAPPLLTLARLLGNIYAARAARRAASRRADPALPGVGKPFRILCVLGSGGHTAEMLVLLRDLVAVLPPAHVTHVATATDDHSLGKARRLHATDAGPAAPHVAYATIPRAREVAQSLVGSALGTASCLARAVPVVRAARPDVVLVNGPGSAVVVVSVVLVMNAVGLLRAKCVYVESVARTQSLSLSGRILYHVVDRFVVQWPGLVDRYPLAEFQGRLC